MRDTNALQQHCNQIERCNQRGGRMLSIVDLIEAGTLSREVAAYALAAIGRGASFLVGARPGGAGKTTVMCALLNCVPNDVELAPADGLETIAEGMRRNPAECATRRCYICHEIGSGPYYAYLWGEELRAYFNLADVGHVLATNLHADTYEQARTQICDENGVPEAALRHMNLMFFLSVRRGLRTDRRIETVWESDGSRPHRQVFTADGPRQPLSETALAPAGEIAKAHGIIERLLQNGARTIEDVRAGILAARRTGS